MADVGFFCRLLRFYLPLGQHDLSCVLLLFLPGKSYNAQLIFLPHVIKNTILRNQTCKLMGKLGLITVILCLVRLDGLQKVY